MTQNTAERAAQAPETAELTRDVPVYIPAADVYETQTDVVVVADMPGVDEKSVEISLENNVLTLTGHAVRQEHGKHELLCQGYLPGDYQRSFRLSEDVDRDQIKARVKDGVLRITLPKAKEKQPRKIAVEAGG